METHLRRLAGMAGDVLGNRETVPPAQEDNAPLLIQKFQQVADKEMQAGRCDGFDVINSALGLFCQASSQFKEPEVSWEENERWAVEVLRKGLNIGRAFIEERRANG